jgi:hypothetical protein
MNNYIIKISEAEYSNLALPVLFEDGDSSFAILSIGENSSKFAWESDIEPEITFIDAFRCSIGIDLIFIIVEISTGNVLVEIPLDYYYYFTKIHNDFLYIVTQLDIIKLSLADLQIAAEYGVSEFIEHIDFLDNQIVVKCLDGQVVNIDND